MPRRLYEIVFIASAIVLIALLGMLNCLQGTPFIGGLKCNYTYTSADLVVKLFATVVFLIFVGLLLGPVAATMIQPIRAKRTKPRRTDNE
jgi:hypothetical protein